MFLVLFYMNLVHISVCFLYYVVKFYASGHRFLPLQSEKKLAPPLNRTATEILSFQTKAFHRAPTIATCVIIQVLVMSRYVTTSHYLPPPVRLASHSPFGFGTTW